MQEIREIIKNKLKKKTRIILDTNFLMLPNQGIDIFTEINKAMREPYRLCTTSGVMKELEKIMKKKSKEGFAAKLGYILAKQKDLKIINSSLKIHTDDAIIKIAKPKTDIIATQDNELRRKLREKGIRTMRYEQKKMILRG